MDVSGQLDRSTLYGASEPSLEQFQAMAPAARQREWQRMQQRLVSNNPPTTPGSQPGGQTPGPGAYRGPLTPAQGAWSPIQMSPYSQGHAGPFSGSMGSVFRDSTNELSGVQTTLEALQAEMGGLKHQLQQYEAGVASPTTNTRGGRTKPKKDQPWFKDPKTDVHKAVLKKLRKLSTRELRELLGTPDNTTLLPHRDAHPLNNDGQATGFNVDFRRAWDDSYNALLVRRAIENVVDKVKDAPEGFTIIAFCPPIDQAAAQHTIKASYDHLKRTYREQNDDVAAAAKTARDRKNRFISRMRQKCDRRLEAVPEFIARFGRDPTDLVEADFMSVDESANGDAERAREWWNMLEYPEHLRTDEHKPLATQTTCWRAFWVVWIYYELDRLHRLLKKPKAAHAVYPRVAAYAGGPRTNEPPKTIPPHNMVDPSWFSLSQIAQPVKINVNEWLAALPSAGWQSYEEETNHWPPFYDHLRGSQPDPTGSQSSTSGGTQLSTSSGGAQSSTSGGGAQSSASGGSQSSASGGAQPAPQPEAAGGLQTAA